MTAEQRLSDEQRLRLQLRLSRRHRMWGANVPATDLDSDGFTTFESAFIEYDRRHPVAIIDYKTSAALACDANTETLLNLAVAAGLPFYIVQYQDNGDEEWCWRFRVTRIRRGSDTAFTYDPVGPDAPLTEMEFARWLHWIRRHLERSHT